ncbi:MAG: VanZ family protein [Clostridiales bacterium]|nr:VanZ family protein [Clostridiales bacterium]
MDENKKEISVIHLILSVILWIATILWLIFIYAVSSRNESDNAYIINSFVNMVNQTVAVPAFLNQKIVKIIVHIFEFALLTIVSYFAIYCTNKISNKGSYAESPIKMIKSDNEMVIIFTLWFTLMNALFDEYHQLFIKGGLGQVEDVLYDSIGIFTVLIICRLVFTFYLKVKGKKEVRYQ